MCPLSNQEGFVNRKPLESGEVTMQHVKSKETLDFAANAWLSRMQADGIVLPGCCWLSSTSYYCPRLLCADSCYFRGAFLCLLHQIDTCQVEAVSLGKLQKVPLRCEASDKSQYWCCDRVVAREPVAAPEPVFTCERWLPFMSQGVIHSEIELCLQEMQINHQPKIQEEANEGDWKVTVVTGDLENAGTTATVSLHVHGEATCSGPIILGSGEYQLFNCNSADIFKIDLKDIGEIYKIRIGHDNSGQDPGWCLEEISLENIDTCEVFCLTVDSWIAENENNGSTWKEILTVRTNKAPLPDGLMSTKMMAGPHESCSHKVATVQERRSLWPPGASVPPCLQKAFDLGVIVCLPLPSTGANTWGGSTCTGHVLRF
ncbi:lipoxygenase homology domain-containing protein 1-like [Panthera leo]|uniref:lipoxygenase homology domain-containing protein 1-like n=1 Tax=Panthera leo TaxID=9689 RepID=UPI001C6A8B67|nr:lipoxygenase homology domain-containing protein 1-like [Panthera leo]